MSLPFDTMTATNWTLINMAPVTSPYPELPAPMLHLLKTQLKCGYTEIELFQQFGLRDYALLCGFGAGNGENILPCFNLSELLQFSTVCFICKVQMMQMAVKERVKEWAHATESVDGVLKLATYWAFHGCELFVKHLQLHAHLPPVGFPFKWSSDISPLRNVVDVHWSAWFATKPAPFAFTSRTYLRASGRDSAIHDWQRDADEDILAAVVELPAGPKLHSVVEALDGDDGSSFVAHLRGGGGFWMAPAQNQTVNDFEHVEYKDADGQPNVFDMGNHLATFGGGNMRLSCDQGSTWATISGNNLDQKIKANNVLLKNTKKEWNDLYHKCAIKRKRAASLWGQDHQHAGYADLLRDRGTPHLFDKLNISDDNDWLRKHCTEGMPRKKIKIEMEDQN